MKEITILPADTYTVINKTVIKSLDRKFESISLQAPSWYDSSDAFDMHTFGSFIDTTMNSAYTAMSSSPSSDSGGGFSGGSSGGGSSGGGSGGGGGGSW